MTLSRRLVLKAGLASGLAAGAVPVGPFSRTGPSAATSPSGSDLLAGVNLAGPDFGRLPGVHGREYLYPTRANVDYYRGLGFRLIRLPFKWERLQPSPSQNFAAAEKALLLDIVSYATRSGLYVALDPHNYAKRRLASDGWSKEHLIGTPEVPLATFEDLWFRLAQTFRANPRVMFGLMNEPVGPSPAVWLEAANGAIAAIRRTGATNLILIPGTNWTGAHSWLAAGNDIMARVVDPARAFAFDVHQYVDGNSSGTKPDAVSSTIGSERIEGFQSWARLNGFKGFLGEFNAGRNPTGAAALRDMLTEMEANRDVWMGWAAWAGGPRWPEDEMFNLEPWSDGRVKEQTQILAAFAAPRDPPAWAAPGAAIDLHFGRGLHHGVGSLGDVIQVSRASNGSAPARDGRIAWFDRDTLRRSDFGLLIEEARTNILSAPRDLGAPWATNGLLREGAQAPDGGGTARLLAEPTGMGTCTIRQDVPLAGSETHTFSVHARRAGRQWLVLRGDQPSSSFAAFDMNEPRTGAATGDLSTLTGIRDAWNRASLTWRPLAGASGQVVIALGDREGNIQAYERGGGAVHVWGASLETGAFATSYIEGRREQDVTRLTGRLRDLIDGPDVTLMIETRQLPAVAVTCEILSADGVALLRRTQDGAIQTHLGGPRQTARQSLGQWRGKRRVALTISRTTGRVGIAATSVPAAMAEIAQIPAVGDVRLGGLGAAALNGFVSRLVVFEAFKEQAALEQLVA